jgi:excisionase family DNA binding protein
MSGQSGAGAMPVGPTGPKSDRNRRIALIRRCGGKSSSLPHSQYASGENSGVGFSPVPSTLSLHQPWHRHGHLRCDLHTQTRGDFMEDEAQRAAMAKKGSPFLSTAQAAFYIGLSRRTLEKMRTHGGGPKYRKHGRYVRYHIKDLDDWSTSRMHQSTAEEQEKPQ